MSATPLVLQLRALAAPGLECYIEPSLFTFPTKSAIGASGISALPVDTARIRCKSTLVMGAGASNRAHSLWARDARRTNTAGHSGR